ncbi:hypothetical protein ALC57_17199, partial [Trachymyrmex cornetzi]
PTATIPAATVTLTLLLPVGLHNTSKPSNNKAFLSVNLRPLLATFFNVSSVQTLSIYNHQQLKEMFDSLVFSSAACLLALLCIRKPLSFFGRLATDCINSICSGLNKPCTCSRVSLSSVLAVRLCKT